MTELGIFGVNDARKLSTTYRAASDKTTKLLLSMISNKIRYFATMGHTHTVWQVPGLIPDAPMYDRTLMTESIAQSLRQTGYVVVLVDPYTMFVAWTVR